MNEKYKKERRRRGKVKGKRKGKGKGKGEGEGEEREKVDKIKSKKTRGLVCLVGQRGPTAVEKDIDTQFRNERTKKKEKKKGSGACTKREGG